MDLATLLADMFPDTVAVAPWLSQNLKGDAVYDTEVDRRAQVVGETKMVFVGGQQVQSSLHVIFAGAYGIKASDRYTLPQRFSTDPGSSDVTKRRPKCLAVSRQTDEDGACYECAYF